MKFSVSSVVTTTVYLELPEEGARALEAITVYGANGFIKCFEDRLGKDPLHGLHNAVRSLFISIEKIKPELHKIDTIRKTLSEKRK